MWVETLPTKEDYKKGVLSLDFASLVGECCNFKCEMRKGDECKSGDYQDYLAAVSIFDFSCNSFLCGELRAFEGICNMFMHKLEQSNVTKLRITEKCDLCYRLKRECGQSHPYELHVEILPYYEHCKILDKNQCRREVHAWSICAKRLGISRDIRIRIAKQVAVNYC